MNKFEIRQLDINGVTENADGSLTVSGYVNETDTWSQVLGTTNRFIEKIVPGAFKRALERNKNVEFLYNHDKEQILADQASGKLELKEDEHGLYMTATIVPTSYGKDAFERIKGGLVKHMSFGFRALKDKVRKGTNGIYERVVHDLELFEVSAVRNPAYVTSSIQARSIELIENINVEEMNMENLKDRYDEIVARGQEIHKTARAEQRDLNTYELEEDENLKAEMKEIKAKMKAEEVRAEVEIVEEKRQVVDKDYRTFEALIHGEQTDETRALSVKDNGASVVPTTVSNEIIEKVFLQSNLLNRVKHMEKGPGFDVTMSEVELAVDPVTGLPVDRGYSFFGKEAEDIKATDFKLRTIRFDQKRLGTAVVLGDETVYQSGIDVVGYSTALLQKRMSIAMDNTILFGNANGFEGILTAKNRTTDPIAGVNEIVTENVNAVGFGEIQEMTATLHAGNLDKDAVWLMNWKTFNIFKKLKNQNGELLLKRDKEIYAKFLPELMGIPVVFDDNMPDFASGKCPILLGNFGEGYGIKIKKELNFQHIWRDYHNKKLRSHTLMMDWYGDGKILRPEAFVRLKVK
ncbi:phage major capsid protein [Bacillus toyonensis]|uniref:phage major capsid protein n=1 Tax=Bacillus toyonensis TaxID=155322 RepID=UPI0021D2B650|nr:phage major capsid protein [Bacillus toyonensis]MCU5578879.1 phage major capsid protein [Bacillus toyonensis]